MARRKKDPKILTHEGVVVYYNLQNGRFYADDKLTGEHWEGETVWGVQSKIDEPLWEVCDREIYAQVECSLYGPDIRRLHASRINKRTGVAEYIVIDSTKRSDYDMRKQWGFGKYGFKRYMPINELTTAIFEELKKLNLKFKEVIVSKTNLINAHINKDTK